MADNQYKIKQLSDKLDVLLKRQYSFSKEINSLRLEIEALKSAEQSKPKTQVQEVSTSPSAGKTDEKPVNIPNVKQNIQNQQQPEKQKFSSLNKSKNLKSNFEKFVGENLINKIGIAITILGVGIGAKYSIENELISPLTRIILGYLAGLGLLGFGIKLKQNYENYSAVLVSGAMAVLYFITFSAYSFYDLFPQLLTFVMMLVFTAFTVLASLNYNKQVIALIGMVGAYAIPFLLSDGTGRVAILFSYTGIINVGILIIAFKKYWKPLYYTSFVLTWLIYLSWFAFNYEVDAYFGLALAFLSLFFVTFYMTFLAYKLLRKEKFDAVGVVFLILNSFLFFSLGYLILESHQTGKELLGVFTLFNAIIHFIVTVIVFRQKLEYKNLFYILAGLVLVFITLAIPVQLDGKWVTLLWASEATLLFWVGRTKDIRVYEKLSYPLMLLAFLSILQDWTIVYDSYNPEQPETRIIPLFNTNFLTSVLSIIAFGFINYINRHKDYALKLDTQNVLYQIMSLLMPTIFLVITYMGFRLEITNYWNQLFADSTVKINDVDSLYPIFDKNYNLIQFKLIWTINYTLLFVSLLAFFNFKKLKNSQLGYINYGLIIVSLILFLTQGLLVLSELRESYLAQNSSELYENGIYNILIRYISFAFVCLALFSAYKYQKQDFMKVKFQKTFDLLLHISVLWVASSELIHWLDIADFKGVYKLGLSILWGVYSLFLIVLGIWKSKKHIRIGAIILFGVTLLKLFFYDISHLNTISKTVVFIALGVLLLIISFLYNKFKDKISDEISD